MSATEFLSSDKPLVIFVFVDLMWTYMVLAFYGDVGMISRRYFEMLRLDGWLEMIRRNIVHRTFLQTVCSTCAWRCSSSCCC